jgi:glycerol-3-phosphate acyltransferase PlsY
VTAVAWLVAAYVLGAVPASYLAGRLRGLDLREHGSRNLGATNVFRVLGWRYAVPVARFDIGKGAAAVAGLGAWARHAGTAGSGAGGWLPVTLGLAAVAGHMYSPFVGFRGGKGVATAAGAFLALAPLAVLISLPVWAACLWLTGYVSLSSLVAVVTFPVWVAVTAPRARPVLYASVGLAPLIVYTHRSNIRRLLAGTENRFHRRRAG